MEDLQKNIELSSNLRLLHEFYVWGENTPLDIIKEIKRRYCNRKNTLFVQLFFLCLAYSPFLFFHDDAWGFFEKNEKEIRSNLYYNLLFIVLISLFLFAVLSINKVIGLALLVLLTLYKIIFSSLIFNSLKKKYNE